MPDEILTEDPGDEGNDQDAAINVGDEGNVKDTLAEEELGEAPQSELDEDDAESD